MAYPVRRRQGAGRENGTLSRRDVNAMTGRSVCPGQPRQGKSAVYAVVLFKQLFLALAEIRVWDDAVGRTHQHALWLVLGADALGAQQRVDDIRGAGRNRFVRTGCNAAGGTR